MSTSATPLHLQFERFAAERREEEETIYNRIAASLFWLDEYLGVSDWAYPDWSETDPVPDHFDSPEAIAAACSALQEPKLTVSQIRSIIATLSTEDAEKVSYAVERDAGAVLAAEQHLSHSDAEDKDIGEVLDGLYEQANECEQCDVVLGFLGLSHIVHGETMSSGLLSELVHNLSPEARTDFRHHLVVSLDDAYNRALQVEAERKGGAQ